MGVCRFFQQGSCRFGTKCHNEHFDVKQYLKTDIESGLNGKMWPFSVYGPFKDKPNLPNFIEDQSFEEVRFQAYESRRQNCFDQFHLQFSREVHEATNKMKLLLQTTPQTIDVMIKLYEIPEQAQSAANTNNNNPFGYTANNAVQSTGSIFSKPTLGAGAGNIFGGATAANGSNANSIFGGGSNATNTNNNIFGAATSTNIFTQQQQQQQQPQQQQLFGQQQQQQQQAFGQQPFGQQQQQQQPGNLFGQQQNNLFGQAQATADIFAQPSPFGQTAAFAPQQQQQGGNIFGQAAVAPQQQNTGNIFAQAAATQPPNGFFGQAAFQQPQQQQQQQQLLQQQQHQQQQGSQPATYTSSIYSRLEDLTAEEIAAFKAEQFLPGQVPFKPPPRELC